MSYIRKITLPLVVPAISAGALLILTTSLAHFGVPSILGFSQGIYTLPTKIYAVISRAGGSFEGIRQGAALSIMLVLVGLMETKREFFTESMVPEAAKMRW